MFGQGDMSLAAYKYSPPLIDDKTQSINQPLNPIEHLWEESDKTFGKIQPSSAQKNVWESLCQRSEYVSSHNVNMSSYDSNTMT